MGYSSAPFCVKEVTRQQETKQQEQRHLSCLFVRAVKVAALWDRLIWFVNLFWFVKDDVLVADTGRSRGSQVSEPSAISDGASSAGTNVG
jgi:hypothetical protein